MRIHEILTENGDTLIDHLRANCGPYLTQTNGVLYRGINVADLRQPVVPQMYLGQTWANRNPADTRVTDHRIADAWFKKKFGIAFRSNHIAFCTGKIQTASAYGDVCIFVPIGNFSICWSRTIHDMADVMPSSIVPDYLRAGMIEQALEMGDYQTSNLSAAIAAKHEIMLQCEQYYMLTVRTDFFKGVLERI